MFPPEARLSGMRHESPLVSVVRATGAVALIVALALGGSAPAAAQTAERDDPYHVRLDALALQLESKPENLALAEAIRARRVQADRTTARAIAAQAEALGLVPLRVPGLWYESHPESGADLAALERILAGGVRLVKTDELGTVERNAPIVASAIRDVKRLGKRALLLSASKGSAEVRAALEAEPDLGRHVPIWVDLVGMLEGTPLLDTTVFANGSLPEPVRESLSHSVRRAAVAPERFPHETRAVHVAAFPREKDVSLDAVLPFAYLRKLGPNDGYVLLDSYLRAPGRVLVVRGSDHYLRVRELGDRLAALLLVLLDELARDETTATPG